MANVQHSALTGSDLHEPKGVASATAGKVYISNGSGSGAWTSAGEIITGYIEDVSTAEVVHVPMPFAGTISKVITVLEGAISNADATVTVKNASAASMGTLVITQSGSAAGDVDTLSPSSNNTVSANTFITVETNGNSHTARKLRFAVVLDKS
ncbi:hypothetical protein OAH58_00920 [bacterium]|nr:hypothetical protein [bacterium]